MLLKLTKHELKASYKLMLIAHAFLLLMAGLLSAFLLTPALTMNISIAILSLLYSLTIIASLFGVQLYIGIRFYKNLFTDEGYLMHTLPTTSSALLHSKIITGILWSCFNFIFIVLSAGLIAVTGFIAADTSIFTFIDTFLHFEFGDLLMILFQLLLSGIASILKIYGCICIGQLFNKNRVVASIIAYFVLTFISQFINLTVAFSNSTLVSYSYSMNGAPTTIVNYSTITAVVTTILFYVICRYIMKKKLNLI